MPLQVVKAQNMQGNVPTVVGVINAGRLVSSFYVPKRDTKKKEGYQREVSQARVNKLKNDLLKKRVDLPTAILLNLRGVTFEQIVKKENGSFYLDDFIDKKTPFYVVDGQHRVVALSQLYQDDPERWSNFSIPFVCMIGADENQEMEQFYIVNSNAKSVRTDLALDLLKQRAESSELLQQGLIEKGEIWKVSGQNVVESLSMNSPVWKYRIRFPNEPKADTMITSSSMVTSLKPLLNTPYFENIKTNDQISILDAYWRAIKNILPEAFEEFSGFTIQKGIGVTVFHNVLILVLEHVRSNGDSVSEVSSYEKVIKNSLESLQGENSKNAPVDGVDFWRTAPDGAAGSYSSSAGQRVLISKIKSLLPQIEVE
ncbi:MAG: DGQHR domain-containing protein [Alphaproteobacteria bacterium]|nr:DGQHR domain-containing protein [Alphaproteobacteria bacterium]NCQ87526.1 DGQHR domain-containing protein [Alphaproteobacteria bacterium]NCT06394.1 DGQHR domain-containing protein [Alphaproteobacteria bacterium]